MLGAVASGLIPILLPLWTQSHSGATRVGIVMALFGFGQLSAPLWGKIADFMKLNRLLFLVGLIVIGLSLLGIVFIPYPWTLGLFSLFAGLGFSLTNTLANLWIVERFLFDQLSERVGFLQRTYGIGQVLGLAIAGILSVTHLKIALLVSALMPFLALAFFHTMPVVPGSGKFKLRPALSNIHIKIQPLIASMSQSYHLLQIKDTIKHLSKSSKSTILFNILWFIMTMGSAFLFSFYPIIMKNVYYINPVISSTVFAIAAALGIFLYVPSGDLATKYNDQTVLLWGLIMRIISLGGLAILVHIKFTGVKLLVIMFFILTVLSWPVISVTGTAIAAESNLPKGAAMGLFSANTALALTIGSLVGGFLAHLFGYHILPLFSMIFLLAAILLGLKLVNEDKDLENIQMKKN
ncbi:MFS transporter [Aceticella autotrophica]|uniref:MFS transporter n=1 Tax=Aceticella autotrophica TaxID=2755338 RepID=A0A975GBB3_9THEO|nr:MFS transporter [Aceticella autotrophica]QSZ28359.1 MFS transporter [Aceticella autotrophica]